MLTNPATPAGPTSASEASPKSRNARERPDDHLALAPSGEKGEEPEGEMGLGDPGRDNQDGRTGCQVSVLPRSIGEHDAERKQRRPLRLHEHRPGPHSGQRCGARGNSPDLWRSFGPFDAADGEDDGEDEHAELEQ